MDRGFQRRAAGHAACTNLNHRRTDAPVRHCPHCGEVVNTAARPGRCHSARHDARRKDGSSFCVDCGARLATLT
jgi:hypothetical protein